jgi:hypothetical protein
MSTMIKEVYDALKEAGASEEKASAAAVAVSAYQLNRGNLVTKEDIVRLERATKEDIARLEKATKEDIAVLDKRLAVVEASLNRVEKLLWAIVVGVIVTAIRVWLPVL